MYPESRFDIGFANKHDTGMRKSASRTIPAGAAKEDDEAPRAPVMQFMKDGRIPCALIRVTILDILHTHRDFILMSFVSGISRRLSVTALLILLSITTGSCTAARPEGQPVYFSHRQHVEKKLACTFCHSGAEKYGPASIPGVEFCMSCHSVIKSTGAEVQKVKGYLARRVEIPWRRVYRLPAEAGVSFNHHRHAAAGIQCVECHGDVAARDELQPEVRLTMAFCVKCHRANGLKFQPASLADDCATCHR
jgi:hypothetical protein